MKSHECSKKDELSQENLVTAKKHEINNEYYAAKKEEIAWGNLTSTLKKHEHLVRKSHTQNVYAAQSIKPQKG